MNFGTNLPLIIWLPEGLKCNRLDYLGIAVICRCAAIIPQ